MDVALVMMYVVTETKVIRISDWIYENHSKSVGNTFHYQLSPVTIYERAMHLPLPKVHRFASSVAAFLGMSDVHECPVGFKWLWWLFTSRHLAVN